MSDSEDRKQSMVVDAIDESTDDKDEANGDNEECRATRRKSVDEKDNIDETTDHKDEKLEDNEECRATRCKSVDDAPMYITTTRSGERRVPCFAFVKFFGLRAVMILHSILAAWRVVVSRKKGYFWALTAGNALWVGEILVTICCIKQLGQQCSWRPSFVVYLLLLLPSIWLLQLHQYDVAISGQQAQNATGSGGSVLDNLLNIMETTWIVVIQESLIYVLLVGRWLNDDVAGKNLSQQLIDFLASASDIMELYALFDIPVVQTHFPSTIAVLAIWSGSFIQFIPVLTKTRNQNTVADSSPPSIEAGDNRKSASSSRPFHIAEIVLAFFFQDGPFLAIRLFIMINFHTISHSLVFFVIKNVVTIILLIYRLVVLCKHKPGKKQQ